MGLTDASLCERLWREHADRLLLYAATIAPDRAEDVLQAVFARLLSTDMPAVESEAAYLFRAVRNEAVNVLRSARRGARVRFFEAAAEDPRDKVEMREQVEGALMQLPQEQREAVVLKIWGDLSFPEAAGVLGVSEKTVEHRYYRGLSALEELLHA